MIKRKEGNIEEMKNEIDFFGYCIEKINPENIGELEEKELQRLLEPSNIGLIEQIKEQGIPLFYSKLGSFYPFLEAEAVDFFEFLERYRQEMRDWYHRELDLFEEYEEAETIYNIYSELFRVEEEEVDSWHDNEFDTLSWRSVYLSKANNTVFLRDVGGYGEDIAIMDEDLCINEIVKRLKEGETLSKIFQ